MGHQSSFPATINYNMQFFYLPYIPSLLKTTGDPVILRLVGRGNEHRCAKVLDDYDLHSVKYSTIPYTSIQCSSKILTHPCLKAPRVNSIQYTFFMTLTNNNELQTKCCNTYIISHYCSMAHCNPWLYSDGNTLHKYLRAK